MRKTARKTVQNPTAWLLRQPIGEDGTHQLVWQIFTTGEDGLGFFSKGSALLHVFPQEGTGAKIAKAETLGKSPPLRAFTGRRRP